MLCFHRARRDVVCHVLTFGLTEAAPSGHKPKRRAHLLRKRGLSGGGFFDGAKKDAKGKHRRKAHYSLISLVVCQVMGGVDKIAKCGLSSTSAAVKLQ